MGISPNIGLKDNFVGTRGYLRIIFLLSANLSLESKMNFRNISAKSRPRPIYGMKLGLMGYLFMKKQSLKISCYRPFNILICQISINPKTKFLLAKTKGTSFKQITFQSNFAQLWYYSVPYCIKFKYNLQDTVHIVGDF